MPSPTSSIQSVGDYEGYLDANDGWVVQGWAYDRRHPERRVEVELTLSSGFATRVMADEFRADLRQNGIGDGRHAFSFRFPLELRDETGVGIVARVAGTDVSLKGSPMPRATRDILGLISGDIVSNCNLRCPFCMVDYSNIRGLQTMSRETFRRALEFAPLLPPGRFWLSCLHEPTLHPQLVEMIESVPPSLRDRISFTTNLAKRLPDETLERLANSGIHSLRVSYDSRDPTLFAELRKGARFEVFQDNLARITERLRAARRRPRLHFITMAFRENAAEIVDLIRYARETLGADSHEVRFMYYLPHLAQWGKERILGPGEWDRLEAALQPLREITELTIGGPWKNVREQFEQEEGTKDYIVRENAFGGSDDAMKDPIADPAEFGRTLPDEALRIRLRCDGLAILEQAREIDFRVNLNRLESPRGYFETLRIAAKRAATATLTGEHAIAADG